MHVARWYEYFLDFYPWCLGNIMRWTFYIDSMNFPIDVGFGTESDINLENTGYPLVKHSTSKMSLFNTSIGWDASHIPRFAAGFVDGGWVMEEGLHDLHLQRQYTRCMDGASYHLAGCFCWLPLDKTHIMSARFWRTSILPQNCTASFSPHLFRGQKYFCHQKWTKSHKNKKANNKKNIKKPAAAKPCAESPGASNGRCRGCLLRPLRSMWSFTPLRNDGWASQGPVRHCAWATEVC